jgi:hypothetical protein
VVVHSWSQVTVLEFEQLSGSLGDKLKLWTKTRAWSQHLSRSPAPFSLTGPLLRIHQTAPMCFSLPISAYCGLTPPSTQLWLAALRQHTEQARAAVLADGQDLSQAAVYVNYALFDTPLEDIYGENVPRLRKIRAEIDPEDVMGLAGGFKF